MKKVKTFFHVFLQSLVPQAPYYHKLIHTRFSFSLTYFVTLIFLVNLLFFAVLLVKANIPSLFAHKQAAVQALERFPDDLTVAIAGGKMISTYDRPYFLWADVGRAKKLLGVVDENAAPQELKTYGAMFLLSRHSAYYLKRNGQVMSLPYGNRNLIVNKSFMLGLKNKINSLAFVAPFIIVFTALVLVPLLVFVMYWVYLFVISFAVYLLFRIIRKKYPFRKTFQFSLHAVSLPLVLDYELSLFNPHLQKPEIVYLMYIILVFFYVFVAVWEAYVAPVKIHRKR